MCGVAGFVERTSVGKSQDELVSVARDMANQLVHRGPDELGTWADAKNGVGLGFRRLAVIDLSPTGHQPMTSASGRFVICFNGEVYNHRELRRMMIDCGMEFHGRSDTEVLLAVIERFGVREAIRYSAGMFAAAIWDRSERRLYLVRDRLGEKPLYYGWAKRTLVFGSELRALQMHPDFESTIDTAAVASLMRFGYIPTPGSIYRGVWKLPPGTILSLDLRSGMPAELPVPEAYWSPSENANDEDESSRHRRPKDSGQAWVDRLERVLTNVVREQVVADVPLGAFLSGGIDSSAIVAMMQTVSATPVKTYTIGFTEPRFDEAPYAQDVARYLGTDHTEWYVTEQMALDLVPQLGHIYDEPFADSSQIPTLLVCQLAKKHVTVCLSGDGGDEIFGGYKRYDIFRRVTQLRRLFPGPLKGIAANSLSMLSRALPMPLCWRSRGDWAISLLAARDEISAYSRIMSSGRSPENLLWEPRELHSIFDIPPIASNLSLLRRLMLTDAQSYLPDDILVKVDRAAMSTSLETRTPFLDHRVVEFANLLPQNCLKRNGESKWVLRELLQRYVPKSITDRPKMGFAVPVADWMRGALRDWCESHLSKEALEESGLFRENTIRELWRRHLADEVDASPRLWPLLMFQEWLTAQNGSVVRSRTAA